MSILSTQWLLLVAGMAFLAFQNFASALDLTSPSEEVTAVSSRVYGGYRRSRLADGSFRPETFAFGDGGLVVGGLAGLEGSMGVFTRDDTIDNVSFVALARMIEGPLAGQNYVPTRDPRAANLLIMVFWGRTIGTSAFPGSGLTNVPLGSDIDKMDAQNAVLLGFDSERVFGQGFNDPTNMMSNILKQVHSGVIDDVEEDRYYVILRAFDFQSAWKQRKIRLLWETRYSLSQRRHDFGRDLPRMTQAAAQFFGQDSRGLVRREIQEGHVEIGDVKSLDSSPEK